MLTLRHTLTALVISAVLALAACSSDQNPTAGPQATDTATPAAGTAAAKPLTADQVSVQMTLQGAPTISADGEFIDVTVNLANHGTTTLSSTGTNPVNLGAHSVDVSGKIIDNDLSRASLSNITPNGQATVTIQLPVEKVLSKSAQILPVQEGVAWFDAWGTKPLTVGPFSHCANAPKGNICGEDGTVLATAPAH